MYIYNGNTILRVSCWCIYIYMVFTTEEFLEVAIESWPGWDLNPRPLSYIYILWFFNKNDNNWT